MQLTLRIRAAPSRDLPVETERTFDTGGGVIGRADSCDWSLPDPDSVLSRRHCEILYSAGAFLLADTSSNGVFINGAADPVGPGRQHRIAQGDLIQLGQYELEAHVTDPRATPFGDDAGSASADFGRPSFQHSGQAAAGSRLPPATDRGDSPQTDELWDPPPGHDPDEDPFGLGGASDSSWVPPGHADADIPSAGRSSGSSEWAGAVHDDHAPMLDQAFPPPGPGANPIPEDWELDIGSVVGAMPADGLQPLAPEGSAAAPEAAASERLPHERPHDDPLPAAPAIPPAPAAPDPVRAASSPVAQEAVADAGYTAFLRGAGLDQAALGGEAPEDVMQRAGELFQQMSGGLRELLQSRANLKNEFRVDRTVIGSANNNPLKFSVDNGDAIVALLTRRRGYMPGLQAVEDGLLDLKTHQIAVIRAMHRTIAEVIAEFAPERVKAKEADAGLGRLVSNPKARNWDAYEEHYRQMAHDMENTIRAVFEKTFARAYEETIGELKQAPQHRP